MKLFGTLQTANLEPSRSMILRSHTETLEQNQFRYSSQQEKYQILAITSASDDIHDLNFGERFIIDSILISDNTIWL